MTTNPAVPNSTSGLKWHKSSYSGTGSNDCVEHAVQINGDQLVRDSKDVTRGTLAFKTDVWLAFVAAAGRGAI
jgi:hypothetical protein